MKTSLKIFVYYLIAFVIMFLPRRWFIFGIQSYRLIMLLVIILLLKKIKFCNKFFNIFTVAYITYVSMHYFIDSGIMSFLGFLIDTVGIFVVLYSSIEDSNDFKLFLNVFCKCIAIYSCLCILQIATEINIFDIISGTKPISMVSSVYYRYGLVRTYGSFTNSINNAVFLIMGFWITFYMSKENKYNKKYMFYTILNIIAIITTLSRAPMMIFFISIVLYCLKIGLAKIIITNIKKIIIGTLLIIVLIASFSKLRITLVNFANMFFAIFDESTSTSISSSFGVNANGIGERADLYKWVSEKISEHELLGLGANEEIIFVYKDANGKTREKTSIENQYLKVLAYFGWIGLILFIIFTWIMLIENFKLYKKNKNLFYLITMLIQIEYIACMFTVASIDDMRMYYLILALMFIFSKKERIKQND